jgi:hypothetical protein
LLLIKGSVTLAPERKFESLHAPCADMPSVLFCAKIFRPLTIFVYYCALAESALFQLCLIETLGF